MNDAALEAPFARATAAAAGLPGVEAGTSYGTPSLKVRGKSLLRVKDADTLVVMCALEDKELLMEAAPQIYFETDHYKGWPAVLVRLSQIDDAELQHRIVRAWHLKASARLIAAFAAASGTEANSPQQNPPRSMARNGAAHSELHSKYQSADPIKV